MNRRSLLGAALPSLLTLQARAQPAATATAAPSAGAVLPESAVADGASHPLSSRFASLAEAQQVYPHATALEDELDWCAIQAAINAATRQGGGTVQVPHRGRAYVLNRGLTINPNMVTLRGGGARLEFRSLKRGERAVWFNADGSPAYGHERYAFEGFEIVGPGARAEGTAGLYFRSDTPSASSRAMVRDCVVRGFHEAVLFGDRAYLIHFDHCALIESRFCVSCPYGLKDAGETISFSQCTLANSYCLVVNTAGFDLKFVACSLDYAQRVVWDNNGLIDMIGCRVEIGPPRDPPFHCNHGRINFFGGFILVTDPQNRGPLPPAFFAFNNASASVHLFSVQGWNWRTSTGRLTQGGGKVFRYSGDAIDTAEGIGHP
ncbi:right-handed parallel beta-helix repeat-containing protein [Belnapia rosea]|uniref:hypothetical protein n=1 Tax=Belnapia rosea TaxID=938405 RepID=UPI0008919C24|nr:hypothetical protein [Belnapia rosea]SDB28573.1 hypothetical protein SAMN02927895_00951 [Belnapia rosea]